MAIIIGAGRGGAGEEVYSEILRRGGKN